MENILYVYLAERNFCPTHTKIVYMTEVAERAFSGFEHSYFLPISDSCLQLYFII